MSTPPAIPAIPVGCARLIHLPSFSEAGRGSLAVAELPETLPFQAQRCFFVHGVPAGQARGHHAHHQCAQLMICTHGTCRVWAEARAGGGPEVFHLDSPGLALLVPPGVWITYQTGGPDACLIVLASRVYEPEDYITDRTQWTHLPQPPTPSRP